MDVKKCSECGTTKPFSEYYQHPQMGDGYLSQCKECVKSRVKKRYYAEPGKIKAYEQSRANLPHRIKARQDYAKTDACKASIKKSRKKWLADNQDKRAAHIILGNAVRDNRIEKPANCSKCDGVGRIHGHHEDYTKPLDVVWVCQRCHKEIHKDIGK